MASYNIYNQDNLTYLKTVPDNTYDSIVTDPPYGIEFLGKDWDKHTGELELWQECLRVLKPGGYLLAFSAARTYHNLASNIEMAGFEIRDQLMWLYSSGFPKAQDIGKAIQKRKGVKETKEHKYNSPRVGGTNNHNAAGDAWETSNKTKETVCTDPEAKQWEGWKTALKPAHEPICMARKPMKGSTIDNVLKHGTGALNIDASRIEYEDEAELKAKQAWASKYDYVNGTSITHANQFSRAFGDATVVDNNTVNEQGRYPSNVIGEVQDYQKFFYCPKVSRKERHIGFKKDSLGPNIDANTHGKTPMCLDCGKTFNGSNDHTKCDPSKKSFKEKRNQNKDPGNNHPTVKPVALMAYLIKLVTPPNGHVLDPFCGSGSTGMAAVEHGYEFTGCELDKDYCNIARKRIDAWTLSDNEFDKLFGS